MKWLHVLFLFCCFCSCDQPAFFEVPQPTGVKNLGSIPRKLHGTYLNATDNTRLKISAGLILEEWDIRQAFHKNLLDSGLVLNGNLLTDMEKSFSLKATLSHDSIIGTGTGRDTIFKRNDTNLLRRTRNQYYLNKGYAPDRWALIIMQEKRGVIGLNYIRSESDLEKLTAETGQKLDSLQLFRPDRKKFKAFAKAVNQDWDAFFIKVR